jgi:SAM-dependent methyltransferase
MPGSSSNAPLTSITPAEWFAAPLGRYVVERDLEYVDAAVADVFGFNALQLGMPAHDFLRASRIPLRCRVAPQGGVDLRADFGDLPVASHSIDLLVLPHVLEFSADPHQVLREVQRVLMPEGHAVILCFNPNSLWGLRRLFNRRRGAYPWCGRFIHLSRLKDWLSLLELDIVAGRTGCYLPPCAQVKWIERFRFMEHAGDRWWPIGGGVYFLHVVKRVRGMRIITPRWHDQGARRRNLAVVPKAQNNDEPAAARDAASPQ